jgi:uncharacterized repeat protein (TIGR01451 family)
MLAFAAGHVRALAQIPVNDDFANATVLSGTNILTNGTTLNATAETNEPSHCGFAASHSIWYDWTAPANGSVLIDLTGSAPGTDVSVYVGKYLTTLSNIVSNADGNSDQTGRCTFPAAAGVVYEVAVDVTNGLGGAVQLSLIFTTSVFPPQITQQPSGQSVGQGGDAIFSVVATGSLPLAYQWLFQGVDLPGATNSILELTDVGPSQAGSYQVTVSNAGGSTNSQAASLTVIPGPPNDDFTNRIVLTGDSVTTTGSNTYATLEPGEPNGGWSGAQSVWWTWTAPATGIAVVGVTNFTGSQVLTIYTGDFVTNLDPVVNASWFNVPFAVQFVVATGSTYQIAVDGVTANPGDFQLDLNFTATNFPPVIVDQPANQTVTEGGSASFQVVVSSDLPCAFQWFFDNALIVGATNDSLVLNNVTSNQAGAYQVQVINASGTVPSSSASLVVNIPPFNDDFTNSAPISGLNFTTTGDNQFATSEPGEPDHAGYVPGASVWWNWTTSSIGEAYVNVTGFYTAETLAIYTGTNLTQLSVVASNAWNAGPLAAHFAAAAGTTYQIAVSDPNGVGGTFQLEVQLAISNFPPTIVTQPPPVTNVTAGSVVQFTNTVTSDFGVTNVWYFQPSNGPPEAIGGWGWGSGAGGGGGGGSGWGDAGGSGGGGGGGGGGEGDGWNLTLTLNDVSSNQSGYYYTVVTSIGGSVTNQGTYVIVNYPPSNDDFTNRIALRGTNLTTTGTTAYATLEPGEPSYPGLTSGGSVWWTWTAPDAGTVYLNVTNNNAAFQVLQVYTGGALTNLQVVAEVGGPQYVLSTSIIVTGGKTCQIAIAGGQSAIGLGLLFLDADIPPQIIQQPLDVTVAAGASASFQVGATGGGTLFYQWFFNGTNALAGATNASLQLAEVTTNQAGNYSVRVSNSGGTANSREALLTVTLAPPNDDFTNRIVLSSTNTNITTAGTDQYATIENGEPAPFGIAKSVWWSWTAPSDGVVNLSLTNYTGDQILAIYTGGNLPSLSSVATAFFYQVGLQQPIAVQFKTTVGTTYQIQVEEPADSSGGSFDLNLLFTPLIFAPTITSQPLSRIVTNEDSVTFQVAASGAPPLTYQWLFGGTNLAGATNTTLELDNVSASEAGSYLVIVSNPGGFTNSQSATLTVLQRPPNDFFTNRIALTGLVAHGTGSNNYASSESGEPAHAGYGPFATVWWSYTAVDFGPIHMDLTNSFYGADMAVYTGTNVRQLTLVSSNAFGNADGTPQLTFLGQVGVTYQIAVQGALPGNLPVSGNISLLVEELTPPIILSQPSNQYVGQGESAVFSVQASSLSPLTYQWQFGGADLPGATNATLVVQNVQPSQTGSYSVLVGNAEGNVESQSAALVLVAVLTGQVTDAVTGDPLPGVRITVGTNVTHTDSSGDYRIAGLTSGGVAVDFKASTRAGPAPLTVRFSDLTSFGGAQLVAITNGYANYTNDDLEVDAQQIVTNAFSMSPLLPTGEMRFVLNWGAQPSDLDAHLLTPAIDGTNYHVYYPPAYRGSLLSAPFAQLNQDATNGFGPETITIAQFFPGTYTYFVHKFAGVGDLNASSASVAVYTEAGQIASFAVPTNQSGEYWYVCDVDGATSVISPVDELQNAQPDKTAARPFALGSNSPVFPQRLHGPPANAAFLWDFGDGTTSQVENPVKTYDNPGLYSVSLTVVADGATNMLLKPAYIQVQASTLPTVSIIAPADGALFSAGAPITVIAGVTNLSAPVTNVLFYAGTALLGAATQSPFSFVWTNAPAGTNILTAVAYAGGLAATSAPVNIIIDVPPSITTQPQSQTVIPGANVNFTVVSAGTAPLIYQWQFDGTNLPGATNSALALLNVEINRAGSYEVIVTNRVGSAVSSNAVLNVFVQTLPQISIIAPAVGSLFKEGNPITIIAGVTNLSGPITNVLFYAGTALLGAATQSPFSFVWTNAPPGTNILTAVAYANDGLSATSPTVNIIIDVPPAITTQPQSQTVIQGSSVAFSATVTGTAPLAFQWQFNGNTLAGATNSTLSLAAVQPSNAGLYSVIVANRVGAATSSNALLTVNVPPTITRQPASVTASQGASVTFGVTAAGTLPLIYQWSFNGSSLPNATNSTLTLPGVLPSNAGSYSVVVGNVAGSATSLNAVLTVNVPPTITQQPVSVVTNQGVNVTFAVGATGSSPLSYQWQFNGRNLSGAIAATLTLSNVQTNQAGSYAVVVTNVAGSTISSIAVLVVEAAPPNNPVISLVSPANQTTFCYGGSIPLQANVSYATSPPTNVAFYSGSTLLLGSTVSAPYAFSWTTAAPGDYSLSATASFADGSTLTSTPVLIAVSAQCSGQVAIVGNSADPEIVLLQNNLFEMGLNWQNFGQAGLAFDVLTNYELVIWDDLGSQTNQLTDNTVSVLQSVYAAGIPLYLIGQNLASSDMLALDESQQSNWVQLTSLTPSTCKGGDGNVEVFDSGSANILDGTFGEVTNFSAAANFDLTTLDDTNAAIMGQSGSTVVLVAFPAIDAGQTRIVTQNFEVDAGADPNSVAQRHALFLNSVCWLVQCPACKEVGTGLDAALTPATPIVGQPLTYQWRVENNGECNGTGTTVTCLLPAGVQFVSAESPLGTWDYNAALGAVIFEIGLLPSQTTPTISFTVIPLQTGAITNTTEVELNGLPPNQVQVVAQVIGLNLLWNGGTNYLLQLSGTAGQSYQIQTSTDLLQWLNWTNAQGPAWVAPLPNVLPTNFPSQFYRALWPQ